MSSEHRAYNAMYNLHSQLSSLYNQGELQIPVPYGNMASSISNSATYRTIVLITGANQGIGFEVAKKLAIEHRDYHIIMTGRREDALNQAVAQLQPLGSVEGIVMDVRSDESITRAAQLIQQTYGRLDVLINNAGISLTSTNDGGASVREQWSIMYDTNVIGVARVTDAFLPLLQQSRVTKRIVIVTSSLGSLARKVDPQAYEHNVNGYVAYSSSKSALNMLALHYVNQFEKDGSWKINLCCPGFCSTNLSNFLPGIDSAENGALNVCRLAVLGPDGETGTWTNRHGPIPW